MSADAASAPAASWADEMNVHFLEERAFWVAHEPDQPFQAFWLEMGTADDAARYVQRHPQRRGASSSGGFFTIFAANRFVCLRRLPSGPVRKVSQWEQLPADQELLLSPEPTVEEVEQAMSRARWMKYQWRGEFEPSLRPDGTLWLKRAD